MKGEERPLYGCLPNNFRGVLSTSAQGIVFGPVPSRRLGRSLGVNNLPPKTCSYSCVYCQLGRTTNFTASRRAFYDPNFIVRRVEEKLKTSSPDYVTFVPDGEPTLDINLGVEIRGIRELGARVAVITNSSLLWMEDVREDLAAASWVSIKVDSLDPEVWRRINRPHPSLKLERILDGMNELAREYRGTLCSETMLVKGISKLEDLEETARFLAKLGVAKAYIAIPTRPPAEPWVEPPGEDFILQAHQLFSERLGDERVGLLLGYPEGEFGSGGSAKEELLSILSVHPMRRREVERLLEKSGAQAELIEQLVQSGEVLRLHYRGEEFYMRKLPGRSP